MFFDSKTKIHFVDVYSIRFSKPNIQVSKEVFDVLLKYDFPGNVRELENIIERGVAINTGYSIEAALLPDNLRELSVRAFITPAL